MIHDSCIPCFGGESVTLFEKYRPIPFRTPSAIAHPPAMASIFSSFPMLRTAAPRLSRQFFTCQARRQLHHQQQRKTVDAGVALGGRRKVQTSWILQCHYQSTHAPQHVSTLGQGVGAAAAAAVGAGARAATKRSAFPKTSDKSVAYWLLGSAASVFGIVIWGGLTRLTESGYVYMYIHQFSAYTSYLD